jgi:hypothetical protein
LILAGGDGNVYQILPFEHAPFAKTPGENQLHFFGNRTRKEVTLRICGLPSPGRSMFFDPARDAGAPAGGPFGVLVIAATPAPPGTG